MPRRLLLVVLVATAPLLFTMSASAQAVKTTATPDGYEEYWRGIGQGGTDSLFHRVYVARRNPAQDTLTVVLRSGERRIFAVHEPATLVQLELVWFKRYLVVDEYPEVHSRRFDHGWSSWYEGLPRRHLRIRYAEVAGVFLKSGSIELPVNPKFPE